MGRLVLNGGALKDNIFMSSELACAGRPMDFNNVTLPRQRDLLLPEPLDVDSGILLGERSKPSPEQVRAQKGPLIHQSLVQSLLKLDKESFRGPLLIVNLTPYVEDAGSAVPKFEIVVGGGHFYPCQFLD
jgi:hypothetical protein